MINKKYEQEFRKDKPETIGETDSHFDLDNYCDWLEDKYTQLLSKDFTNVIDGWVSVKDKKPRKNQEVLFVSISGQFLYGYYDKDDNTAYANGHCVTLSSITHWIKPKKPK